MHNLSKDEGPMPLRFTLAVFTLETDYPSQTDIPSSKSVKIDGKQMDKVRRIAHPKLGQFQFQIKRIISLTQIIQRITRLRRRISL